ncbi:chemotaxis protein [Massilia sp. Root418]|jgi:methyl-accepting chemotaxis protein|uniref:methyl-accepting chemotaxis protein n=1 Tax=Massilia sp. Root418 TaxID=1736532 RepID=UPI0006FB7012|nr:methyl-accepting chemotaxis protein [Massilia sp. Root418]KQW96732.1 chemotaxis protein [Massilia sp. Root418]
MDIESTKISTRLATGFGLVFLLLIIVTALGINRVQKIDTILTNISDVNNVKQRYAINFRGSVHDRSIALRDVVLAADAGAAAPYIEQIKTLADHYAKSAAPLDQIISAGKNVTPEEKGALEGIKASEAKTQPLIAKVIALRTADQLPEATALLQQQAAPAFVEWLASVNKLIDLEEKMSMQQADSATSVARSFFVFMVVLCLIAIGVGVAAAWFISRGLLRQLGGEPEYAASIVGSIAAGNLAVRIDTKPGDNSSLLHAMQAMRDSLVNIVSQVRAGTQTIATNSREIAAGNMDLSSRTEQQAANIEETASSMEQLTGTVKQNSDHAHQANQLALSASEVAVKGGAVVNQVVHTMASINESSKKIVDIIGVIDSIAFQTNILALNAAVEAARAGEQGRGFAVVATEVRNLAQRSAGAAKEIKSLIDDSVEKVDAGAKLVDQAGATMQDIVNSVKRVTDIMGEISTASAEQTSGIEQVNEAVGKMDQVVQQNAALVEQAAAAAASLQDQAGNLSQVVSIFKLDDSTPALLPRAPTASAPAARPAPAVTAARTAPARRAALPTAKPAPRKAPAAAGPDDGWEEF